MQEKQMKENERARMKEQMHAKELKWMEEITMKQNIRNKANAKLKAQEEERAKMASREAREKLTAIQPTTLGQATHIPGVSPADLTALLLWLELQKRRSHQSEGLAKGANSR